MAAIHPKTPTAGQPRAAEGHARLGALLDEAAIAMCEAVAVWRRGTGLPTVERHVDAALTALRRVRARVALELVPMSDEAAAMRARASRVSR